MSARRRPPNRPTRPQAASRSSRWPLVAAAVVGLLVVAAVLSRSDLGEPGTDASAGDRVAHVHGLGVNPDGGALYAATHFGLFRLPGTDKAMRVGKRQQDTMGFTVVGPDHFLASGHPDMNDTTLREPGKPPLLGLIESRDGGETWKPLSLLGAADFHSLVAAHGQVYGFDSTGGRFMVSSDGRSWETRSEVPMADFAVDPADADHIVATTERGLVESRDGARSFEPLPGPPLIFLSWNSAQGLWGISPNGDVYTWTDSDWERRQAVGGRPQALLATDDELYAAIEIDEVTTIVVSSDGGQSWTTRYRDSPR